MRKLSEVENRPRRKLSEVESQSGTEPQPAKQEFGTAETVARNILPRSFAAEERDAGVLAKAGAGALDALSLPGRVAGSVSYQQSNQFNPYAHYTGNQNLTMSPNQNARMAADAPSVGDIDGGSTAQRIIRDPALLPTMVLGGPLASWAGKGVGIAAKAGRLALAGAGEGALSGTVHATERGLAGEGAKSLTSIPTEAAIGSVLGPVAGGLGWTAGKVTQGVRSIGKGVSEMLPQPTSVIPPMATPGAQIPAMSPTSPIGPMNGPPVVTMNQIAPPPMPSQLTRHGITLTPSQVAGEATGIRPAIEMMAQSNPFLSDIPGEIIERNALATPAAILKNRNALGNKISSVADISPSDIGGRIDDAARAAKKGIGDRFGLGQDEALIKTGIAGSDLPTHYVPKRVDGKFVKNQVQDLIDEIDNYTGSHGYDVKKGFTGQESGLSKSSLDYVEKQKELLRNTKTTKNLLDQQRRIGREIYDGSTGDAPLFRDRDVAFLEGFERKLGEQVERQFDLAIGSGPGKMPREAALDAKNLWNASKLQYSGNRKTLEGVAGKLGVDSKKVSVEQYFDRIKSIGNENLSALKKAASESEELEPLFKELQTGFFDHLLKKSASKMPDGTLGLSPEKIVSEWINLDKQLKETMVPKAVIDEMDDLVSTIAKSRQNNAALYNPSGTARLSNLTSAFRNKSEWVQGLLMRGPIKEYYKTGNIMRLESMINVVNKAGINIEKVGSGLLTAQKNTGLLLGSPGSKQVIRSGLAGSYMERN